MSWRLPTKDSATGRALRVLSYLLISALFGFVTDPDAVKFAVHYLPWLTGILITGAPIWALLYNLYRSDVKNY